MPQEHRWFTCHLRDNLIDLFRQCRTKHLARNDYCALYSTEYSAQLLLGIWRKSMISRTNPMSTHIMVRFALFVCLTIQLRQPPEVIAVFDNGVTQLISFIYGCLFWSYAQFHPGGQMELARYAE
ncbi:hypothetical protein D3C77_555300 [compost metagenome]